ncbi:hypothetical protein MUK42_18113 [Musa troglodytarum]|uniref:Uncharacterized protein n=1 Tax=Musa troglodytarum TaxID=320322 RepID=A0A9E7HCA7_9LILI|nr:hypothetical protein MUK42_18113 [Musa troglodytarum]
MLGYEEGCGGLSSSVGKDIWCRVVQNAPLIIAQKGTLALPSAGRDAIPSAPCPPFRAWHVAFGASSADADLGRRPFGYHFRRHVNWRRVTRSSMKKLGIMQREDSSVSLGSSRYDGIHPLKPRSKAISKNKLEVLTLTVCVPKCREYLHGVDGGGRLEEEEEEEYMEMRESNDCCASATANGQPVSA